MLPRLRMLVYAIRDLSLSPSSPLGEALDVFIWREDAERFIEEVERDEPELAERLWIEERELQAGALTSARSERRTLTQR